MFHPRSYKTVKSKTTIWRVSGNFLGSLVETCCWWKFQKFTKSEGSEALHQLQQCTAMVLCISCVMPKHWKTSRYWRLIGFPSTKMTKTVCELLQSLGMPQCIRIYKDLQFRWSNMTKKNPTIWRCINLLLKIRWLSIAMLVFGGVLHHSSILLSFTCSWYASDAQLSSHPGFWWRKKDTPSKAFSGGDVHWGSTNISLQKVFGMYV